MAELPNSTDLATDPMPKMAKRNRESSTKNNSKHPVYRRVRMRARGKWVSEIRKPKTKSRTFSEPEMAARGKKAILNFPQHAEILPLPDSSSEHDVGAAASKAAAMHHLSTTTTTTTPTPPSTSAISTLKEVSTMSPFAELDDIIELPSLGESYESAKSRYDYVFVDSGWDYYSSSTPWPADCDGIYFPGEPLSILPSTSSGTPIHGDRGGDFEMSGTKKVV